MIMDAQYTLRQQISFLLRKNKIRPKKSFGQNFLVDDEALTQILAAAKLTRTDTVVEVGPGLGVMTEHLSRHARDVIAIELDDNLAAFLKETTGDKPNINVISGDILQMPPSGFVGDNPYLVVANLPYSIAAGILRHFLEAEKKPQRMIVMVQKQVAENICASPGRLGILGISVQIYSRPRLLFTLKPDSFFPSPKVDSAVIELTVYDKPQIPGDIIDAFFATVRAGFRSPRKQIRNSLALGLQRPTATIGQWLLDAHLDPRQRPQTLTIGEWANLTTIINHSVNFE
jgi:16S rRNA (adenine1518-N6/adenine1519-N6)-dimethyltransferase